MISSKCSEEMIIGNTLDVDTDNEDYLRSNLDIVSLTFLSFDPELGLLSFAAVALRFPFLSFVSLAFLWSSVSAKGFFKLVSDVSGV